MRAAVSVSYSRQPIALLCILTQFTSCISVPHKLHFLYVCHFQAGWLPVFSSHDGCGNSSGVSVWDQGQAEGSLYVQSGPPPTLSIIQHLQWIFHVRLNEGSSDLESNSYVFL